MENKIIRLLKALRYETFKRLPYVFALLLLLGVIGGIQSYRKLVEGVQIAKSNITAIKRLSEDNKVLLEQNKKLSTQNLQLAQENAKHIDCLGAIFANYTRTGTPVADTDLNSCIILTLKEDTSARPTTQAGTSPLKSLSQSPSPSQSAPSAAQGQSDKSQGGSDSPSKPLDCKIDLLGLHIGCP